MSILFCVFIKKSGQTVKKPHHDNYFLTTNKNLFLWRHFKIISVLLFSKVSGSAQMMETFSEK